PLGNPDRTIELQLRFCPSSPERAPVHLDHHLGDGTAIQVAAFGFRDRDPLRQVVQQLVGFVVLMKRGVAEDTNGIEGQRGRGTDLAAQTACTLSRVQSAPSVYLVMVESSRRFSD